MSKLNKKLISHIIGLLLMFNDFAMLISSGVSSLTYAGVVNENSKVLNKQIMDLDFPLTAIIGGVIRNNQGIIALGGFEIQLGDRVLVCSKPESIKKVESLFL